MKFEYRGVENALTLDFRRTIRVPDNKRDTNLLPPDLGQFPIYLVQDYINQVPAEVAVKSGIFFTMYQREAMWINFAARLPFAVRVFVGGINAVSGEPMDKRRNDVRERGESAQDYMVVPGQPWLDGIVCEDGKIRQFVAQPKDNGFSVETQVTGEDAVGGIQIEIIPIKCVVPRQIEVLYKNAKRKSISRKIDLEKIGLGPSSTWKELKPVLQLEFGIPVDRQVLYPHVGWNHYLPIRDDDELNKYYFAPGFVLGLSHDPRDARLPQPFFTNGMTQHGTGDTITIKQTIVKDPNPADKWDMNAAILFHVHILDTAMFAAVTRKQVPKSPISAKTYAEHASPFFAIWGEEPTGIKGNFDKVKSIAELEELRAKANGTTYVEEETVPQRVAIIGTYKSTFKPVGIPTRALARVQI
ncbi:hypothetical protein F5Y12DRAFT_784121 [Xylaria sp. FL1777]|nr:hypothetical protein F5Y12DRAFT_784121 [Xylaria sp. FL1777]